MASTKGEKKLLAHGGATTTDPDATPPQLSVKPCGGWGAGGGGGGKPGVGGVLPGVGGEVFLPGIGGGGWPGVWGASSQGVRGGGG